MTIWMVRAGLEAVGFETVGFAGVDALIFLLGTDAAAGLDSRSTVRFRLAILNGCYVVAVWVWGDGNISSFKQINFRRSSLPRIPLAQ